VETIASALSEDVQTVEEFIEPYLLRLGFIKKSSRGRSLSPKALISLTSLTSSTYQKKLL